VEEVDDRCFGSHDGKHQQPGVVKRIILELGLLLWAVLSAGLPLQKFI
jgi:hypothetical protein